MVSRSLRALVPDPPVAFNFFGSVKEMPFSSCLLEMDWHVYWCCFTPLVVAEYSILTEGIRRASVILMLALGWLFLLKSRVGVSFTRSLKLIKASHWLKIRRFRFVHLLLVCCSSPLHYTSAGGFACIHQHFSWLMGLITDRASCSTYVYGAVHQTPRRQCWPWWLSVAGRWLGTGTWQCSVCLPRRAGGSASSAIFSRGRFFCGYQYETAQVFPRAEIRSSLWGESSVQRSLGPL